MPDRIHPSIAKFAVPVESLHPHPQNARRGNVAMIAKSLEVNGQYKPIIVRASDGTILAGNHTFAAAVRLGWEEIAALRVDVDDDEALRILLIDNRASDLATYDDFALADLLREMPDLEGTGFSSDDLTKLLAELDAPLNADASGGVGGSASSEGEEPEQAPEPVAAITCPDFTATLEPGALAGDFKERFTGKAGNEALIAALGWPAPVKAKLSAAGAIAPVASGQDVVAVDADLVPVADLKPHPANPRQGDVGAIAESLAANGQYRPIVVNKRTMHICAGNHTYFAARALGWDEVAVTWVDVDDVEEARILLVDNKAADAGGYDSALLLATLTDLDSLEGTGFTFDDLDDLAKKAKSDDPARRGKAAMVFTDEEAGIRVSIRCDWAEYDAWFNRASKDGRDPKAFVLAALGLTERSDP